MAKGNNIHPIVFFIAATLLLSAGSIMNDFPIFIFFGFTPLFALTDRTSDVSNVWEKMEWVFLSLVVYFLAIHLFDFSFIVSSFIYGIVFTLPFIGFIWVRQVLGKYIGNFTIILFWLAIEFALLKLRPSQSIFLADTLRFRSEWMVWNTHTGYLGASAWILLGNFVAYQAFLSENRFQWYWITLLIIIIAGPLIYSFMLNSEPITRKDLMNLYRDKLIVKDVTYLARGEFIVRTSAWISALILLITLIKSQTSKR
ncbi:hypothetical protein BH09BAC3_BH09BAC3_27030 [soil metagenome]